MKGPNEQSHLIVHARQLEAKEKRRPWMYFNWIYIVYSHTCSFSLIPEGKSLKCHIGTFTALLRKGVLQGFIAVPLLLPFILPLRVKDVTAAHFYFLFSVDIS